MLDGSKADGRFWGKRKHEFAKYDQKYSSYFMVAVF